MTFRVDARIGGVAPRRSRARACCFVVDSGGGSGAGGVLAREHVRGAAEDERRRTRSSTPRSDGCSEVDLDVGPALEAERGGALVGAEAEQRSSRDDVARPASAAGDALELAQLLERVDADVRVRADADADAALAELARPARSRRRGSPRSSGRRRRARPPRRAGRARAPSACVAWTTVVRGPRQPVSREQLDRADAVLGEALLDLARLLVGVDVQRQALARRRSGRSPRASRAGRRARSGGRRRRASPRRAQRLDAARGTRRPTPAGSGRARRARRRREEHELDARLRGGLDGGERLVEAEVVELADGRVAGGEHLAVDLRRSSAGPAPASDAAASSSIALAPGPEVAALGAPAQRALEGVAVRVHEARQGRASRPPRVSLHAWPPAPSPRRSRSFRTR